MFGFKFLENFNYPYIAKSVTEFWRRWHISLSSWFKDYVYIPLGGNKKGKNRTYLKFIDCFFFCVGFAMVQVLHLLFGVGGTVFS